jgi:hypothetical protein
VKSLVNIIVENIEMRFITTEVTREAEKFYGIN